MIENGEAVGVDITPVKHLTTIKPDGSRQHLETVSGAENNQAVRHRWEGQIIDLIFGDKNPRHRRRQVGITFGVQSNIRVPRSREQRVRGIDHAQADTLGFVTKSVTPREAGDA